MTDNISREAVKDAICRACSIEGDFHKCDGYVEDSDWCEYMTAIRAIPAADVRENKRGRWERIEPNDHYDFRCVCSNCRKYWIFGDEKYDFNFCPNCGADMRGTDDAS